MRTKTKMILINNYVDIYKILFECKQGLIFGLDTQTISTTKNLLEENLKLKNNYEELFKKLKIDDVSYLILKKDLEEATSKPAPKQYILAPLSNLNTKKEKIKEDYFRINLKYQKLF